MPANIKLMITSNRITSTTYGVQNLRLTEFDSEVTRLYSIKSEVEFPSSKPP